MCELADLAEGINQGCRYHGHSGSAVIQEVGIVLGFKVGVDGYRDRTQLYGTEKGGHELRAVKRCDQHPVLDLDAVLAEGVAHPVGAGRDLRVRLLGTIGGTNGDLVTPAGFEVAVQQIGTCVVAKRQFSGRPNAHADSLEVRPASGRTSKVGRGVWKAAPADLRRDLRFLNSLRAARNRARAGRPCVGAPEPAAWAHRAVRSEP